MPQERLYSVSAIARELNQPESTLHYWKNRFDTLLPSVGQGRHRRFRAEALEVFRTIGTLLGAGLSVADAKAELSRRFPETATAGESGPLSSVSPILGDGQPGSLSGEEMAMRIGTAMAEAIGHRLQDFLAQVPAPQAHGSECGPAALPGETVDALKAELARTRGEIETLQRMNEEFAGKFKVLEAELIRLRRDGREMEKHLLGKIKGA